jgi:uncharacterized membrane protein YdbT with pleckstrin-like domain
MVPSSRYKPALRSFFVFYAAIFLFGIAPLINPQAPLSPGQGIPLALILIFYVVRKYQTTLYQMSDRELIKTTGIFQAKRESILIAKISRIELRQGIVHRLLKVGHLRIIPQEAGMEPMMLFGIHNPREFKEKLEELSRIPP